MTPGALTFVKMRSTCLKMKSHQPGEGGRYKSGRRSEACERSLESRSRCADVFFHGKYFVMSTRPGKSCSPGNMFKEADSSATCWHVRLIRPPVCVVRRRRSAASRVRKLCYCASHFSEGVLQANNTCCGGRLVSCCDVLRACGTYSCCVHGPVVVG